MKKPKRPCLCCEGRGWTRTIPGGWVRNGLRVDWRKVPRIECPLCKPNTSGSVLPTPKAGK